MSLLAHFLSIICTYIKSNKKEIPRNLWREKIKVDGKMITVVKCLKHQLCIVEVTILTWKVSKFPMSNTRTYALTFLSPNGLPLFHSANESTGNRFLKEKQKLSRICKSCVRYIFV